jgi:uncharacterized protein YecE (DUF72 family)
MLRSRPAVEFRHIGWWVKAAEPKALHHGVCLNNHVLERDLTVCEKPNVCNDNAVVRLVGRKGCIDLFLQSVQSLSRRLQERRRRRASLRSCGIRD